MNIRYLTTCLSTTFLILSCTKPSPVTPVPGGDEPEKEYTEYIPSSFKDEPDDAAADPAGTFDYATLASMGHPRLLMTTNDFGDLKDRITGEKALDNMTLYKIHKQIMDNAAVIVEEPVPIRYEMDASGKRLLAQSRIALKRLTTMAYAYRMTGSKKYLDKAQYDLRTVCAFEDWHPSHYLDVAEMTLGVAIAYDWLYYVLDNDLRVKVRQCLVDYALKTSVTHSFHSTYNNWNQVCNGGIICAAIAVYEKDKAASAAAIEKGIASNTAVMNRIYAPDGNYSEGYGYWEYGTSYEVVLLTALQKAFGNMAGLENTPGFMQTAEFMLFMDGATKQDFSYADGGGTKESPRTAMWWFAAQAKDPALLKIEWRLLSSGKYPTSTSDEARLLPLVPGMIKGCGLENLHDVKMDRKIWAGHGVAPVAMVHSKWTFDESDCYLGIKGGSPSSSHSHMDGGSFVFDAKGKRWSMDMQRPNYAETEKSLEAVGGNFWNFGQKSMRWDIVKMNNIAHSTLCFNNSDGSVSKLHVTDQVVSGKAEIVEVLDKDGNNLGAKLDLSSLYSDQVASAIRTVTMVNECSLKVVDEITAKPGMDARMEWRMLTPAIASVTSGGIVLTQDEKTMTLSATSSVEITLTTWDNSRPSSWTPQSYDIGLSGTVAGFTATVPAGKTVRFETLLR